MLPRELDEDEDLLEKYGNAATRDLIASLNELCNVIPHMGHLSVLSLQVSPRPEHMEPRGFHIPREFLNRLVARLPTSVQHLEIETRGHERVNPEDESSHICATIAACLQTLKSLRLRLRLSRFCPKLFAPSESLTSLVLNMVEVDRTTKTYLCEDLTFLHPWEQHTHVTQARGQNTCRALALAGLNALSQMPNLNEFVIFDAESYIRQPLQVDRLRARNVLRNETTTFPLFSTHPIHHEPKYIDVLRKLPFDGGSEDVLGIVADIETAAEGSTWSSAINGSRLPRSIRNAPEGRRYDYTDEKPYVGRSELESQLSVPFWDMEAEAGRQLVQAVVQDGVMDLEPLTRDEYEKPANSDSEEEEDEEDDKYEEYEEDHFEDPGKREIMRREMSLDEQDNSDPEGLGTSEYEDDSDNQD